MARIVQDLAAPFGVEYGDNDGKTKNNEIHSSGQEGKKTFSGDDPWQGGQSDHSKSKKYIRPDNDNPKTGCSQI